MFTGKVAERDIDALGDSIGGPIGDVISWAGQGGNPKGAIDGARQVIHGAIDGVAGLFS